MRPMLDDDLVLRGRHVMTVCNACRYCEQCCPVFPALESDANSRPSTSPTWRTSVTTAGSACARASSHRHTNSASTCRWCCPRFVPAHTKGMPGHHHWARVCQSLLPHQSCGVRAGCLDALTRIDGATRGRMVV